MFNLFGNCCGNQGSSTVLWFIILVILLFIKDDNGCGCENNGCGC